MDRFFYKLFGKVNANKITSLLLLLFITSILGYLAFRISFEEDISKLIPADNDTAELQKVLNSVNFTDKIIVNIQKSENASTADLTKYAAQFTDSITKSSSQYIASIQGKVADEDILGTLDFVYNNLPLYLEKEDYKTIQEKIKPDSITKSTEANYKALISPSSIITKNTILKDPLGLSFIALKKLQKLGVGDDFKLKDGYLLTKDENNLLLFISPKFSGSETDKNSQFADNLYNVQNQLNGIYEGKIKSEYFGAALIAVANAKQIKNDIQFTVGIAVILLILLLIFFYRKVYIPLILFVPTVIGALLAMSFLYFFRGTISAISLGIGSVLLGVTLDYSLHILTHIRNNETIKSLYKDVTEPILMSSLTTSLAFLCLLFLNSQALQDLGIFAAISVLGASIFALIFIPVVYKNPSQQIAKITFLDNIGAYKFHRNKIILGILAILFVTSIFTYKNVGFEDDISKLNYEPIEIIQAQKNLESITNLLSKSIYIASYGKSVEETLQRNDSIYKELETLQKAGKIESFGNVAALVHSKKKQIEKIKRWRQFWNKNKADSVRNNLIESGETFGFKTTTHNQFYQLFSKDFNALNPEDYQVLPSVLLGDYIHTEADFTTVTSVVKIDSTNIESVKNSFKKLPNTVVIDRQEINQTFLGNLKNDFNYLMIFCLLVVLAILFLFFRSFSLTLVTIVPIFLTWFLTIGVMGIFRVHFNIFNIIISTFIFGLGIDYSIFITKGLRKQLVTGQNVLPTNKTAILLSVITTILGVGVLIFAKHPALYAISIVSIIGIFSAMIMAFTVQPLLFKLFIGGKTKQAINLRVLLMSVFSFGYFGFGGLSLSFYSWLVMPILPISKRAKMNGFHTAISKYMKSVLYTNPFVKKRIIKSTEENFTKPAVIIANHTSFLDVLSIGMLHPKICFFVNDWVYNSPIFGKAIQRADFFPVSTGIENNLESLKKKIEQGYSFVVFPEGSRSKTNKINRFHKGAFFLAEKFGLDVLPILIHGNSEVNPKGSFVIEDGAITLKILPRIEIKDDTFGENYTTRSKNIRTYFKAEMFKLKNEVEAEKYYNKILLKEYRFKGENYYAEVKKDLKNNAGIYRIILNEIDYNEKVLHLSEDFGQLDFLLMMQSAERTVYSIIENEAVIEMLQNSYLTNKYEDLQFFQNFEDLAEIQIKTLLISNSNLFNLVAENISNSAYQKIILLKKACNSEIEKSIPLNYKKIIDNRELVIFERNINL